MYRVLSLLTLSMTVLLPQPGGAEEFLPTPYTADQIGDAWREGYEMTMKVWTPAREIVSRTTVEKWSRQEITTSEQELDASGAPAGDKSAGSSSWEDLRDHARFPTSTTSRQRESRKTVLGDLDGWLFTVKGEGSSVSEFFFADNFPGPPVFFSQTKDGSVVFRAETIEIKPAP